MNFNDLFKNEKDTGNNKPIQTHSATPQFYEDANTELPFGVIVLTEDCVTALPLDPKASYLIDNNELTDWRLFLFSISENKILGSMEYYYGLRKLCSLADIGNTFVIGEKDGNLITTPLTHQEMQVLMTSMDLEK